MPQTSSKRCVSFDEMANIVDVDCDYSPEEVESYWFRTEEFTKMRRRDRVIARKVAKSNNEENYCVLGLIDDQTRHERRDRSRASMSAVFREQESQWREEIINEARIASACFEYNHHSSLIALERGLGLTLELKEAELAKSKKSCRALRDKSTKKQKSVQQQQKQQTSQCLPSPKLVSPKKSVISKFLTLGSSDRKSLVVPRH